MTLSELTPFALTILALKCAALFILGTVSFDVVHYVLHVWEHSRFSLLRKLGGLHAVHHEFLDRSMQIRKQFIRPNLIHHVLPEYLTGIAGTAVFGFVFGWFPAAIVIVIRTVMVVSYFAQKGIDFTHEPRARVNANRSLLFVGPHYHALHHIFVRQHYSSFLNVFDLVCGTNCQLQDRNFLVLGNGSIAHAIAKVLKEHGAHIQTAPVTDPASLRPQLEKADVLIVSGNSDQGSVTKIVDLYREIGLRRLLPPEVWSLSDELNLRRNEYYQANDVTYRRIGHAGLVTKLLPMPAARASLFLIRRGFESIP